VSVKHRPDDEVLELLARHEVPEELTREAFYLQVEQQLRQTVQAGRRRLTRGQIAESFAKTFGFTHWVTLRYLLKRREKLRKKERRQVPAQPVIPDDLNSAQQGYLKKLRYRKAELVGIQRDGREVLITHRTAGGNLVTYRVDARGNAYYVSPTAD